jgi:glucose dehydrogenase
VNRILPNPAVYDYDYHAPCPVLADGVLYLGSGDGSFHAVRPDTGARVWRVDTKGPVRATAALDATNVIFGTRGNFIFALERATGKTAWEFDARGPVTTAPALIAGRVIVGSRSSNLFALDPDTGKEVWSQFWWGSWVDSTAVAAGELICIGSGDLDMVSLIDPATGRNLWRTDVGGWAFGRPAVTVKNIFTGVSGARRLAKFWLPQAAAFAALDRATGKLLWSWPLPDGPGAFLKGFIASPIVADHTVLIGGLDGTLYAFPAE